MAEIRDTLYSIIDSVCSSDTTAINDITVTCSSEKTSSNDITVTCSSDITISNDITSATVVASNIYFFVFIL